MFFRRKPNRSGSTSIQIIQKIKGKNKVLKTIGCSKDPLKLERLEIEAKNYIDTYKGQLKLELYRKETDKWFAQVFESIESIHLAGPELVLGKLFDEIGFNEVEDEIFRHMVISRLITPGSKLKTIRDLRTYYGVEYSVDQVYRYLDKLSKEQQDLIQQISYNHTLALFSGMISMVFYDVTTIYFEAEKEDDLRIAGFSKEGKHRHPQILLGLLVSIDGYPLAYDIFPGNTYEGHTFVPTIERFKNKFSLKHLIVVADAGLMTKSNVEELEERGYEYILGARIKTESKKVKEQILNLTLKDGQHAIIRKEAPQRLIIHYSTNRATKDEFNRKRGIKRLEKALSKGKLTKSHINNRGYNKYLELKGDIDISINYEKFEFDANWDGLKGYVTNTKHDPQIIIKNYSELWKIEKAFRISKTDLRVRPIFHRLESRIKAHITISFAAYKIFKELERKLNSANSDISVHRALELIKSLKEITIRHPQTKKTISKLFKPTKEQNILLNLLKI